MNRDEARIATPCDADWTSMAPRDRSRLCGTCDKLVHNLSALGEREARALLRSRSTEGLCIRYLHDAHGEIWFGDAAGRVVPASRLARRGAAMVAAAGVMLVPILTEACGGAGPDPNPYNYAVEGADGGAGAPAQTQRQPADPTLAHADAGSDAVTDSGPAPFEAPVDAATFRGADAGAILDDASGD